MFELQRTTYPRKGICVSENMFLRGSLSQILFDEDTDKINLKKGATLSFNTYFNAFSLTVWDANCDFNCLFYGISGQGLIRVKLYQQEHRQGRILLEDVSIPLSMESRYTEIKSFKNKKGILYAEISALTDCVIVKSGFYTSDLPRNDVKLGIVVTHFKRKKYVLPAIQRINKNLLQDPLYKNKVSLVVVDNSQDLLEEECEGAILLPNKNMGGSGGFSRGLFFLDESKYTHCLFMDDDGSCEIESIRRVINFYAYCCSNEKLSIAGTLFLETTPNLIHEKGAQVLKKGILGQHHGLDVNDVGNVILADNSLIKCDYGAWCFCAFPIQNLRFYPFPFFVRGDDVLFGAINKFKVISMIGIAVTVDDFNDKESPITKYLSFRSTLVCSVILFNISRLECIYIFLRWYLPVVFSYNYVSAQAIILALEDMLKGPSAFIEDMCGNGFRKKISDLGDSERKVNFNDFEAKHPSRNESQLARIFRWFTLNGLLLPAFAFKTGSVIQPCGPRATFREIFRYKKVVYVDTKGQAYVSKFERLRIVKCLFLAIKAVMQVLCSFNKTKRMFRQSSKEIMTKKFWESVF